MRGSNTFATDCAWKSVKYSVRAWKSVDGVELIVNFSRV